MTSKQEQRNRDADWMIEYEREMGLGHPNDFPNGSSLLIARTLVSCTRVISNRLIELDGTLEEIGTLDRMMDKKR